ncbi:MAG: acyltransferase family protein [Clostridia bacterium]|nr:acyltransferase family protein [Clostridia bacterium]
MKRNANVDLFRIAATLLVVLLHVLGQGGVLRSTHTDSVAYWCVWFLEICAFCAVNCFALISGYVMEGRSIKLKSIIGLWLQVLFYSLAVTALFFALLPESRTVKNALLAFMPIVGQQWWYASSYFALFFFIPFLNAAIKHISRQTYKKLLLLVLLGIGVIDCVFPYSDAFSLNSGYSAVWLMLVYLFGAYIKKYELHKRLTAAKSILGFFAMAALTLASKAGIHYLTEHLFGKSKFEDSLVSYMSVTVLLASVFLFLFFLNLRISKPLSRLAVFLSPVSLGVYLIHVHPLVFGYVLKDAFVTLADKPLAVMLPLVLAACIGIFAVCAGAELLRIQLFRLLRVNRLCEYTAEKLNALYLKLFYRRL